jgi:hypothetical protein
MTDQEYEEIMTIAHKIKMCICNRYYYQAQEYIEVLAKNGIPFTIDDADFLYWLERCTKQPLKKY